MRKNNHKKNRCSWVNLKNREYVSYHDNEWGCPVHEDKKHFEMLILEGAQAGLSWETILNKRDNYRKLFAEFNPQKISRFSQVKIEKLLSNAGIVRNRLKIESAVTNAKAFIKIQREFGSFDNYIWGFVDHQPIDNRFKNISEYPKDTILSKTISKDLKQRGFRFVGSTIIYAYMQAVGLVNDHVINCCARKKENQNWYLYMISCKDGSLYTGVTTNVERRVLEHQAQNNKSAKYLRGKNPLKLVYSQFIGSKSQAHKIERIIKDLSKQKKEEIVKTGFTCVEKLLSLKKREKKQEAH